jgi:phosphopantothenoylcysteine decarboxylase
MVVAPAMNTMMWDHPITLLQITQLKNWGCSIVEPVQKTLICGDSGKGAMADLHTIQ